MTLFNLRQIIPLHLYHKTWIMHAGMGLKCWGTRQCHITQHSLVAALRHPVIWGVLTFFKCVISKFLAFWILCFLWKVCWKVILEVEPYFHAPNIFLIDTLFDRKERAPMHWFISQMPKKVRSWVRSEARAGKTILASHTLLERSLWCWREARARRQKPEIQFGTQASF